MKIESPTALAWRRLRKNPMAIAGLIWILAISTLALFADQISYVVGHPPAAMVMEHRNVAPSWMAEDNWREDRPIDPRIVKQLEDNYENIQFNHYWFGTDDEGRDLFVRILHGARISFKVALIGTLVALIIGVAWGATAGYLGGWCDEVMMRFVDILYALPYIFFVILIMTIFERSETLMFACIGAISWLTMARIVRGEVKSLKERDYVMAALALGAPKKRIIAKHMIPNILGIIIVYATLMVPQLILTETFLSFLGLGIQPPDASWGNLMKAGATLGALQHYQWQLLFPGISLSLTLLALNFVGDGLRDAFDPKLHR